MLSRSIYTSFGRSAGATTWRRAVPIATLSMAMLVPVSAQAQPGAIARENARALMAEGRDARDRNDLQTALTRFTAADAIMRVPTTQLEVAKTQADFGLLVEARDTLHDLSAAAPDPSDPPAFARARQAAAELDHDLLRRIPTLFVTINGAAENELSVKIDGEPVPALALASGYWLDPGPHHVVAEAEGAHTEAQVELAESVAEQLTLELVPRPVGPEAPPTGSAVTGATGRSFDGTEGKSEGPSSIPQREGAAAVKKRPPLPIGPIVLGGVSLAALATGVAFGLTGESGRHDLEGSCAPTCTATEVDRVQRDYTFANISFSVGAVTAASALLWYALTPAAQRRKNASTAPTRFQSLRLEIATVPSGAALGLRASF